MEIDGNRVRIEAINAITEPQYTLSGVNEGTDKIARGAFEVLLPGQKLTIGRWKRCRSDDEAKAEAMAAVRADLNKIWKSVVDLTGL